MGRDQSGFCDVTRMKDFDKDIIIANGTFTYCPRKKQGKEKKPKNGTYELVSACLADGLFLNFLTLFTIFFFIFL